MCMSQTVARTSNRIPDFEPQLWFDESFIQLSRVPQKLIRSRHNPPYTTALRVVSRPRRYHLIPQRIFFRTNSWSTVKLSRKRIQVSAVDLASDICMPFYVAWKTKTRIAILELFQRVFAPYIRSGRRKICVRLNFSCLPN